MKIVYLLFGAQGSGKSTQGERLAKKLSLPFFDTGNELRKFIQTPTKIAKQLQNQMGRGQLVSNQTLGIIIRHFLARNNIKNGLVIDGFPRNLVQCELLNELAKEYNWQVIGATIEIGDATAYKRLAERRVEINGQLVRRPDDEPAVIAERLNLYKLQTVPVFDYLKKHYRLVSVDGEPGVDQVTQNLYSTLGINDNH